MSQPFADDLGIGTSEKNIAVLRLIADGRSYAQIVDGRSDISYMDIFNAAEEALKLLESRSGHHGRLAGIKKRYPNSYERWHRDEDRKLTMLHQEGRSASEISAMLRRQPSAIRSRIAKLGLSMTDAEHEGG